MDNSLAALSQKAISAALCSRWKEALKFNQQIIEEDPSNIEALNRLGRAYFELGNLTQAKKHFEEALKKDPYNQIAAKFLKRISAFRKKGKEGKRKILENHNFYLDTDLFIEEPGKTKVVTLLKVAEPQKLSLLSAGLPVNLIKKNRGITITDQDGGYLGILPDDIAHRLLKFLGGGNKYRACIKTMKINTVSILIREVFRSSRFRNQPSFLDNLNAPPAYSSNIILREDQTEEADFLPEEVEEENL